MIRCGCCKKWFKNFQVSIIYGPDAGNYGPGYLCDGCSEQLDKDIRMED